MPVAADINNLTPYQKNVFNTSKIQTKTKTKQDSGIKRNEPLHQQNFKTKPLTVKQFKRFKNMYDSNDLTIPRQMNKDLISTYTRNLKLRNNLINTD
jgi:hypothetical protein